MAGFLLYDKWIDYKVARLLGNSDDAKTQTEDSGFSFSITRVGRPPE